MNETYNKDVIDKACEIISSNLGEMTANYYREFYQDKNSTIILDSLNELLIDLVGPKNAKKKINSVKDIINKNK